MRQASQWLLPMMEQDAISGWTGDETDMQRPPIAPALPSISLAHVRSNAYFHPGLHKAHQGTPRPKLIEQVAQATSAMYARTVLSLFIAFLSPPLGSFHEAKAVDGMML